MRHKLRLPIYALYPKRCVFCGRLIAASQDYCDVCAKDISCVEEPTCPLCGSGKKRCSCGGRRRFFSRIAAPFYFEGAVRHGIHRFKFRGAFRSADYFARKMAETARAKYADICFDMVLCVPMTRKSSKKRGYNQSVLLSQKVAESIGVPFCEDLLIKLYETESQHGLKHFLRKGNLTGVFDVSRAEEVNGKNILLIDDVKTSGETLDECAKMLYLYDAAQICALTLALTDSKHN